MLLSIILYFVGLVSILAQDTAIPLSPSQYSYYYPSEQSSAPRVSVEYFVDLGCSACLEAWPTLMKVAQVYSSKGVVFGVHIFPLPYHQQAFILSKAAGVVDFYSKSANSVFTFMNNCFENQVSSQPNPFFLIYSNFISLSSSLRAPSGTLVLGPDLQHCYGQYDLQ
jgi:hypothetical protein